MFLKTHCELPERLMWEGALSPSVSAAALVGMTTRTIKSKATSPAAFVF